MGWMLIAPEFVIIWAARQLVAAHDIAKKHKGVLLFLWISNQFDNYIANVDISDRGWTITHGFFLSMGGFVLYNNDVPGRTLELKELEQLVSEGEIDWPIISKEEIDDKSKGDLVSKGLAVLQTTWFTVQCIARGVVKLNLTQLELATLAFAVLNIILYGIWWDKPLGVARSQAVRIHCRHPTTSDRPKSLPPSALARFWTYFRELFDQIGLFSVVISGRTFYTPLSQSDHFTQWVGLIVGILFGGIHCIAWFFVFPSTIEEYIWRGSAAAITVIPIIFFIEFCIDNRIPEESCLKGKIFRAFRRSMIFFWVVVYFVSRIALLVLSLLALRSLPPKSLSEIEWSSFIPHLF